MPTSIKRVYGKERNVGNILFDTESKKLLMQINLGFFGRQSFNLVKNEDESFKITKTILNKTENSSKEIAYGRLFPAKNKEGQVVQGICKGSLGLISEYDREAQKNLIVNDDVLLITTHKLKEEIKFSDSSLIKVGYITGIFGIEENDKPNHYENDAGIDLKSLEILNEEIPF